jgi:hypothetical protein
MKEIEPRGIWLLILKAKVTQRDRFILLLILCLANLVNSLALLLAVKQLPDLVQLILTEIVKHL